MAKRAEKEPATGGGGGETDVSPHLTPLLTTGEFDGDWPPSRPEVIKQSTVKNNENPVGPWFLPDEEVGIDPLEDSSR